MQDIRIFAMQMYSTHCFAMSSKSRLFFLFAFLGSVMLQLTSTAQEKQDERKTLSIFYPSYSINLPSFDMNKRFGLSHSIGAGYTLMFKNNWLVNVEGNFLFGRNIKHADSLFRFLTTRDGNIIDQSGNYAQVALSERGFTFWLKAGKLIPIGKADKGSGLLLMTGAGIMQHKIRIDVSQNTAPQLRSAYKKGYDHLCNGPAITEFIGYQYFKPTKKINFFAGLDFTFAWTQSRRAYYFSEMIRPNEKRFDMLTGIKVGWIIHINRRNGREYYYY